MPVDVRADAVNEGNRASSFLFGRMLDNVKSRTVAGEYFYFSHFRHISPPRP